MFRKITRALMPERVISPESVMKGPGLFSHELVETSTLASAGSEKAAEAVSSPCTHRPRKISSDMAFPAPSVNWM